MHVDPGISVVVPVYNSAACLSELIAALDPVLRSAHVVGRYVVHGGSIPGFPLSASIVAQFSGAQLFTFSIMTSYLPRVHFRLLKRPTYTVRSTLGPAGR